MVFPYVLWAVCSMLKTAGYLMEQFLQLTVVGLMQDVLLRWHRMSSSKCTVYFY